MTKKKSGTDTEYHYGIDTGFSETHICPHCNKAIRIHYEPPNTLRVYGSEAERQAEKQKYKKETKSRKRKSSELFFKSI